ncbi:hypothetical protein [Nonomuraea roseola]|uniref:Uncharacterized protein n=1 Tax=Nonomuraea roseola TaxID=46179 RepID=A0ABV5PTB3_9ACTN
METPRRNAAELLARARGGDAAAFDLLVADGKTPPLRLLGTRSQEGSDNLLVRYAAGSEGERRR